MRRRTLNEVHNRPNRKQRTIIYKALESRIPIYKAVELAGLNRGEYDRIMNEGLKSNGRQNCKIFRKKVLQLKAKKMQQALEIIEKMGNGGLEQTETIIFISKDGRQITKKKKKLAPIWTAHAWWLERQFPEDFAIKKDLGEEKDPGETAREINQALSEIDESVPEEMI